MSILLNNMVVIVDYKMGNLRSVQKAFQKVGCNAVVSNDKEIIKKASKIVLPGVGAFRDCINNLKKYHFTEAIKDYVKTGKLLLGICHGMHVLLEKSYEFGEHQGLGLIAGEVIKFQDIGNLPVPHMGWNSINIKKESRILSKIKSGDFFYFAHSYYVKPLYEADILTTTDYGIEFTSSVNRENIFGVQFHPGKSQEKGLQILKNFVKEM